MSDLIFYYNPTGQLYLSPKNNDLPLYSISITQEEYLICQSNPTDLKKFKPSEGWFESNEPEDHLDNVAQRISSLGKNKNILCFSYKDKTLAFRLKENNSVNIDYLFEKNEGILGSFPEDYESNLILKKLFDYQDKYDLIIFRHYLEHFKYPKKLLIGLKKCLKRKGLMYLEVPDCNKFILFGNPLFLWEQHLSYFTQESLINLTSDAEFGNIEVLSYGDDIEPSLACYCTRLDFKNNIDKKKRPHINKQKICKNIKSNFSLYVKSWQKYFKFSKRKKLILGIGHNADRFMQIVNAYNYIDYLVDDDVSKHGKFLIGCDKSITSLDKISNVNEYDFILATHDRSFNNLSNKLFDKYGVKNFFSIFKMPINFDKKS